MISTPAKLILVVHFGCPPLPYRGNASIHSRGRDLNGNLGPTQADQREIEAIALANRQPDRNASQANQAQEARFGVGMRIHMFLQVREAGVTQLGLMQEPHPVA